MGATSSRPSESHDPATGNTLPVARPERRRTSADRPRSSDGPIRPRNATSTSRPATAPTASRLSSYGLSRPTRPSLLKRKSSSVQGKRERDPRRFSLQNVLGSQRRGDDGEQRAVEEKGKVEGKVGERESSRVEEREVASGSSSPDALSSTPSAAVPIMEQAAKARAEERQLVSMIPTPSLPTSPGPPVLYKATRQEVKEDDEHMGTSYFEPDLSDEQRRDPIAPGPDPVDLTPTPTALNDTPATPATPANPSATGVRSRPYRARGLSLPITSSSSQRTVTGRLSAMLGFSAPAAPGLLDSTPSTAVQTPTVTPTSAAFPLGSQDTRGGSRPGMAPMTPLTPMTPMTPMPPTLGTARRRSSGMTGTGNVVPAEAGAGETDADDLGRSVVLPEGLGLAGIDRDLASAEGVSSGAEHADQTVTGGSEQSDLAAPREDRSSRTTATNAPTTAGETTENDRPSTNTIANGESSDPNDPRIAELRRELDEIGTEVERVTRQIENLNARRRELERQPVGAMLVIQGLAQTQVQTSDEEGNEQVSPAAHRTPSAQAAAPNDSQSSTGYSTNAPASSGSASGPAQRPAMSGTGSGGLPRRPAALRRMSDGSLFRRRRERQDESGAALDQQARMIGGLLTVAAAATANTLLQPPARPAPPTRSGVGGAIDNLISRLRPNRSPRRGIEQALGSYLRNVARDGRRAELTGERNRPSAAATAAAAVAHANGGASTAGASDGVEGEIADEEARPELGPDFQQFLEDLQNDLVGAVRAYAAHPQDEDDDADSFITAGTTMNDTVSSGRASSLRSALPGSSMASSASTSTVPNVESSDASCLPVDSTPTATSPAQSYSADPTIPTYHRQLGQNLPAHTTRPNGIGSNANRFGVTGGSGTGQARSLNFFRAHLFPPSAAEAERQRQRRADLAEGEEDVDDTIVPCIFVGVRSMQGAEDIGESAEELAQSPGFPFGDGAMTPGGTRAAADGGAGGAGAGRNRSRAASLGARNTPDVPRTPNTPAHSAGEGSYFDAMPPASASRRQPERPPTPGAGLRRRGSSLSTGHAPASTSSGGSMSHSADSHPHSRPSLPRVSSGPVRTFRDRVLARLNRRPPPERPMNTYLVYVVGGNYPRNHPVLRIPALLTGGVLTDEDMTLIGELLGPAKPPTASKDDIAKSGLRIVDGSEIAELGAKGEVHENTMDRCLVCLGDYEEGEKCRLLQCKHVYHQECVDRWLEQGANSCPACRNQAVEKTGNSASTAPAPAPASATTSTRPSLSRAASALSATPPPLSPAIPIPRASTHAQASGLMNPDRPLSVVPESEGPSNAPSPVPSLTAPIDVGSVGAQLPSGSSSDTELVTGERVHVIAGEGEARRDDVE